LLKNSGKPKVGMGELNRYMRNNKVPEFTYDTLKVAYDTDPRLQSLIGNFDQKQVSFNQGSVDSLTKSAEQKKSNVHKMAMKAVNLKK
jgi:hypothetical protein